MTLFRDSPATSGTKCTRARRRARMPKSFINSRCRKDFAIELPKTTYNNTWFRKTDLLKEASARALATV
eukprot:4947564-Pyramimonas_sp.AAC.1